MGASALTVMLIVELAVPPIVPSSDGGANAAVTPRGNPTKAGLRSTPWQFPIDSTVTSAVLEPGASTRSDFGSAESPKSHRPLITTRVIGAHLMTFDGYRAVRLIV